MDAAFKAGVARRSAATLDEPTRKKHVLAEAFDLELALEADWFSLRWFAWGSTVAAIAPDGRAWSVQRGEWKEVNSADVLHDHDGDTWPISEAYVRSGSGSIGETVDILGMPPVSREITGWTPHARMFAWSSVHRDEPDPEPDKLFSRSHVEPPLFEAAELPIMYEPYDHLTRTALYRLCERRRLERETRRAAAKGSPIRSPHLRLVWSRD